MSDNIFTYKNSEKGIIITGLADKESVSEIIIPDTIDGTPVTTIGEDAFYKCKNLKNVKLGKNVRYIENNSFAESGITHINLEKNIKYIGNYAFEDCRKLNDVTWNCDLSISEYCFAGCSALHHFDFSHVTGIQLLAFEESGLKEAQLTNNVEYIENGVFRGSNLEKVQLGKNIRGIGDYAFSNCRWLKEVVWDCNNQVTRGCFYNNVSLTKFDFSNIPGIDEMAFSKSGLIEIQLDKKVERIEKGAFSNCKKLSNVIWNCPQSIPQDCFKSCTSLKNIDLSKAAGIDKCAFSKSGLREIQLDENLQRIGEGAFSECKRLKNAIWNSKKPVPRSCFEDCTALIDFDFHGLKTIGVKSFSNSGITSVHIEKGTTVRENCFSNCKSLTKVEWKSNKEIKNGTFEKCPNLKEVLVSEQVKAIEADAFKKSPNAEISFI